jgi:hypothetical protein
MAGRKESRRGPAAVLTERAIVTAIVRITRRRPRRRPILMRAERDIGAEQRPEFAEGGDGGVFAWAGDRPMEGGQSGLQQDGEDGNPSQNGRTKTTRACPQLTDSHGALCMIPGMSADSELTDASLRPSR